jgi:transcriptional regulator with XRE-family HTH domain
MKVAQQDKAAIRALSRAIGEGLRRAREARGWSRGQLVALLPSGIGDRTLLSYEHGTRHLTVVRLVEVCRPLGVAAPTLLSDALQRARRELDNLVLRVALKSLISDDSVKFRPLRQWAKNKLNRYPDGIVELEPSAVEELADFVGYKSSDLANYLAKFVPDEAVDDGGTAEDDIVEVSA